jgi:hypothetical protein
MCIVCGSGSAHLLRAIAGNPVPQPRGGTRLSAEAVAPPVTPPLDPRSEADLAGPADVILRGGPILTMSAAMPSAAAAALRAGRIQAVGDEKVVLAHRGRLTRVIDLDGRVVLPGFVNAHWHMPFALLCEWVDATAARSLDAVTAALESAACHAPAGEWIVVGVGAEFAERLRASTVVLAGASPSHPALVCDPDGAIVTASAAAAAGGKLPAHISGLLSRFAARIALSPAAATRRASALLRQTAAAGVTCLRVCGLGTLCGGGDLHLMRAAVEIAPPLRLRATLESALLPEWNRLHLAAGFGDDAFRVDTLSAWLGDDTQTRLTAIIRAARDGGWSVTVHAADEAQIESALDAFASAGVALDQRCGVECRRMPTPSQVATIRRLGLSVGLTGGEHQAVAPFADARDDAGVPISLGLDVVTGVSAPLRMVRDAVQGAADVPNTLGNALAAVTIDAARRCGVGDILGSLERGKYADLVFLDADPRTADLASIRCLATWVDGREAFRA